MALPTVCVIGGGSSGIAAAKALHRRGFQFDCTYCYDYLFDLRRERRKGRRRTTLGASSA